MNVFFLAPINSFFDHQYRTTWLHQIIFHGESDPVQKAPGNPPASGFIHIGEPEYLSVTRSGRFVPEIWSPSSINFVVSESIATRLSQVAGVQFRDVRFSKIVDLPMPKIGDDICWGSRPGPIDPDTNFDTLPDSPELKDRMKKFYAVNRPIIYRLRKQLDDIERIKVNFGSYADGEHFSADGAKSILFSKKLLQSNAVLWDTVFIFREDAFAVIAPHLDRDHFWLAWKEIED